MAATTDSSDDPGAGVGGGLLVQLDDGEGEGLGPVELVHVALDRVAALAAHRAQRALEARRLVAARELDVLPERVVVAVPLLAAVARELRVVLLLAVRRRGGVLGAVVVGPPLRTPCTEVPQLATGGGVRYLSFCFRFASGTHTTKCGPKKTKQRNERSYKTKVGETGQK